MLQWFENNHTFEKNVNMLRNRLLRNRFPFSDQLCLCLPSAGRVLVASLAGAPGLAALPGAVGLAAAREVGSAGLRSRSQLRREEAATQSSMGCT